MRHVSFDNSRQDLLRNGNDNIEEEEEVGEKDSKKRPRRKAKGRRLSSSTSEDEGSVIRRRLWRKLVEDDCKSSGTDVTLTSTTSNQSNISVVELPPDFRAVIFIWSFSLVYALFDDQLMSKEPLDNCSLTSSLSSQLHISSVSMALAIPFILGPVLSIVLGQVNSKYEIYEIPCSGCSLPGAKKDVDPPLPVSDLDLLPILILFPIPLLSLIAAPPLLRNPHDRRGLALPNSH